MTTKSFINRTRWLHSALCTLILLFTLGVGQIWGTTNPGDLFEQISATPASNDEIIFVNQAETYACGTQQNSNNRTPIEITTSSHQYIYTFDDEADNNVQVFVVKKVRINNNDRYGFHTGSGYIYSGGNSNNKLYTNSTTASTNPSGTSAWSISINNSVYTITNHQNTARSLAFNGTDYFSQYSGQSRPYVYKKVMSAPTGVAASSITANSATITITDATNVNYYELYYSTSSTAPLANATATTTIENGKSTSITGLTAGTNYYVWARTYTTSPSRKTGWIALTGNYFTTLASSCGSPTGLTKGSIS